MAKPAARILRSALFASSSLRNCPQFGSATFSVIRLPGNTCRCSVSSVAFQKNPKHSIISRYVRYAGQKSEKDFSKVVPLSWPTLALCLVAGGGIVWYVRGMKEDSERAREKEKTRSVGKAALGGPFELTDHNGNPKTDKDFLGQWILIYFGFTHCPDICPDQLEKMTEVLNRTDNTQGLEKIQPLYVSVDPDRDDIKTIKEYLKDFHPRFLGLTGTEEQTKKVTKAYRVYYSSGPKDEDDDYIVDHTIIWYLVNPEGQFVEYFGQNRTIDEISATIANRMLAYKLSS